MGQYKSGRESFEILQMQSLFVAVSHFNTQKCQFSTGWKAGWIEAAQISHITLFFFINIKVCWRWPGYLFTHLTCIRFFIYLCFTCVKKKNATVWDAFIGFEGGRKRNLDAILLLWCHNISPRFWQIRRGLRRGVLNAAVCSAAAITTALPRPQKSLSATWCMKAHCLLIQLWVTPPTPSAQMQYDPAATIHFSLWRRFNEFLLRCVCMSLCLPPSFWSSSPSVRLGNASAAAGEPLCFFIFLFFFDFTSLNSALEKSEQICISNLYILRGFYLFLLI